MALRDVKGANRRVIAELERGGFTSIQTFLTTDAFSVCRSAGISKQYHQALLHAIYEDLGTPFISGPMIFSNFLETSATFKTCDWFDDLVGGGLQAGSLVELVGEAATGKTQVCLFLAACVAAQPYQPCSPMTSSPSSSFSPSMIPASHSTVIYIDTNNTAQPSRFCDFALEILGQQYPEIFSSFDFTSTSDLPDPMRNLLHRIQVFRSFLAPDILVLLQDIERELRKKKDEFYLSLRLLVIDNLGLSVAASVPVSKERNHLMSEIAKILKLIATTYGVAIVFTNYLVGLRDNRKPALGQHWRSVADSQILLRAPPPQVPGDSTPSAYSAVLFSSRQQKIGMEQHFFISSSSLPSS